MRIDAQQYQQVLGDELRKVRKRQGWTRKELNRHLTSDISVQTLATYELGTRQCSVVRLAEICLALGEAPHEVLGRAHARLFTTAEEVELDLMLIVRDGTPALLPLRRWAHDRLRHERAGEHPSVHLDPSAVARMAELCQLSTAELLAHLRDFSVATSSRVAEPDL